MEHRAPPPLPPKSKVAPAPAKGVSLGDALSKKIPKSVKHKETVYHLAGQNIKLQEDEEGGVGGSVWISCVALFHHLEKKYPAGHFQGKKVLELGSGTGLIGIALAMLGADVVMTDLPGVVPLMALNYEANKEFCKGKVSVEEFTWGNDGSTLREKKFDLIFASECLYNSSLYSILYDALGQVTPSSSTSVFISFEPRIEREHQFFELVQPKFRICERVETEIQNHKAVIVELSLQE